MINMFASLIGYNNLIGEPVNKYRTDYKALEKLRERFFRRVKNDIDLDKFVDRLFFIKLFKPISSWNIRVCTKHKKCGRKPCFRKKQI